MKINQKKREEDVVKEGRRRIAARWQGDTEKWSEGGGSVER